MTEAFCCCRRAPSKYGKLVSGQALFLNNAGLVRKEVSHMKTVGLRKSSKNMDEKIDLQIVLGNNGGIWVGAPPAFKGDRIQTLNYSSETQQVHAVASSSSSSSSSPSGPASSDDDDMTTGAAGIGTAQLSLQQRAEAERLDALRPVISMCVEGIARLSRLGVQLSFDRVATVYNKMLEGSDGGEGDISDQWVLDAFVLPAGQ